MAPDVEFTALTDDNRIAWYHARNLNSPMEVKEITGLKNGEEMLSIDYRPAAGQLYALGSSGRIYIIKEETGAATALGEAPFSPNLDGINPSLDFNPTVDRIRTISKVGKRKWWGNLKFPFWGIAFKTNPVAFATSSDNKLYRFNPMDPTMNAVDLVGLTDVEHIAGLDFRPVNGQLYAYTNSFAGATATVLYVLDSETDMLYRQDPPNDGVLVEIGSLGVEFEGENGFDIGGSSDNPFALLKVGSGSAVYSIDLMSGKARKVADFNINATAMAVGLGF